jgi:hypothetical protein
LQQQVLLMAMRPASDPATPLITVVLRLVLGEEGRLGPSPWRHAPARLR